MNHDDARTTTGCRRNREASDAVSITLRAHVVHSLAGSVIDFFVCTIDETAKVVAIARFGKRTSTTSALDRWLSDEREVLLRTIRRVESTPPASRHLSFGV